MELDFYNIQKWKFSLPKKKVIFINSNYKILGNKRRFRIV